MAHKTTKTWFVALILANDKVSLVADPIIFTSYKDF
jgi:hypothetical protein